MKCRPVLLFLALACGCSPSLTEVRQGGLVLRELPLPGHDAKGLVFTPVALAISEDGEMLAALLNSRPVASLTWSHSVRVLDLSGTEPIQQVREFGRIDRDNFELWRSGNRGPVFTNDAARLLTVLPRTEPDQNLILVADGLTGDIQHRLPRQSESPIVAFAFSSDQTRLAACAERIVSVPRSEGGYSGYVGGHLHLWDLQTGELLFEDQWEDGTFRAVAFAPDGSLLAVGAGELYGRRRSGEVRLYELPSGRHVRTMKGHDSPVDCLAFAPDGKTLVSTALGADLMFWNLPNVEKQKTIDASTVTLAQRPFRVSHITFSSDGTLLAVALSNWNRGQKQGEVRILSAQTRETLAVLMKGHDVPIVGVAFSGDGSRLAAQSLDVLKFWSAATEEADQAAPR